MKHTTILKTLAIAAAMVAALLATTARADLLLKYADGNAPVEELDLGVRPAGAWTEPLKFILYTDGPKYTVSNLDYTPSSPTITYSGEQRNLPWQNSRSSLL